MFEVTHMPEYPNLCGISVLSLGMQRSITKKSIFYCHTM